MTMTGVVMVNRRLVASRLVVGQLALRREGDKADKWDTGDLSGRYPLFPRALAALCEWRWRAASLAPPAAALPGSEDD